MKHLVMLATAAATLLGAAHIVQAEARRSDVCRPGESRCEQQPPNRQQQSRPEQQQKPRIAQQKQQQPRLGNGSADRQQTRVATPRRGESAKLGRPFQRAQGSRFQAPPRGQEYRVINEHLVLVDTRSLQIVSVLGLLNTLLR